MTEPGVIKHMDSTEITPQQLAAIHKYTRRPLEAEELYVFKVNLCDNEVDRDGERFTIQSLYCLADLFVGKTGIFDHNPKGDNQTARIFEAQVVADPGRITSAGETYHCLCAWAYMVRSQKNADLILEIDGGIKKEVSVSCAVSQRICSICGANRLTQPCSHQPGADYETPTGTQKCHILLEEPTDAYEWSFVAIPAQPQAGVTKAHLPIFGEEAQAGEVLKAIRQGETSLSQIQAAVLCRYLDGLEELAKAGENYLETLRKEYVRLSGAALPSLEGEVARQICEKMTVAQLEHCNRAMEEASQRRKPVSLQLGGDWEESSSDGNRNFKI